MAEFVKVAVTTEIQAKKCKKVEVQGKMFALCLVDGTFLAIDDACAHMGGSLSDGDLDGDQIECPRHGARFKISTGELLRGPGTEGVRTYQVRVNGLDVELEV